MAEGQDTVADRPVTLEDALAEIRSELAKVWADDALLDACRKGSVKQMKAALENGAQHDIADEAGNSPMHLAVLSKQPEAVEFLLTENFPADLTNKAGFTPLNLSMQINFFDITAGIIDAGADIHRRMPGSKETPLIDAAYRNQPETVSRLLKHGAKADDHDANGVTAAMRAAAQNNTECLKRLLVDGKADPYMKSNSGRTAFDFAVQRRAYDCAEFIRTFTPEYMARTAVEGNAKPVKTMKPLMLKIPGATL